MPHLLGYHNRPIVELYLAEFETDDGSIILECWSMEPVDAAVAFRKFFSDADPNYSGPTGRTRLEDHPPGSDAWRENLDWWRGKVIWTGDYLELAICPGTRVTIGKTTIEYNGSSYSTWSEAHPSFRDRITRTARDSLRTHAAQDRIFRRLSG